jgi:hypothetical protein
LISCHKVSILDLILSFIENPQDVLFETTKEDMDKFFEKINQFEKITNQSLKDIWKENGPCSH